MLKFRNHNRTDSKKLTKAKPKPTQLKKLGIKPYPMLKRGDGLEIPDFGNMTAAQAFNYHLEYGASADDEPLKEQDYPIQLPDDYWETHSRCTVGWRDMNQYGLWNHLTGIGWMTEDEYEKFMLHPELKEDPSTGKPMLFLSNPEEWLNSRTDEEWIEFEKEQEAAEKLALKKAEESDRQAERRLKERAEKETLLTRRED